MNISPVQYKNNISFNANLTQEFIQQVRRTKPREVEKKLAEYGIKASFGNNKAVAACCLVVADIFKSLDFPLPKRIKMARLTDNAVGSCSSKSRIKFDKSCRDIVGISKVADLDFAKGKSSTNHFLDIFVHEFSHATHLDCLQSKNGYGRTWHYWKKLDGIKIPLVDRIIIKKKDGAYALTDLTEFVAEKMTRRICSSLDDTYKLDVEKFSLDDDFSEELKFLPKKTRQKIEDRYNSLFRDALLGNFSEIKGKRTVSQK